jgi:hypothetical protein
MTYRQIARIAGCSPGAADPKSKRHKKRKVGIGSEPVSINKQEIGFELVRFLHSFVVVFESLNSSQQFITRPTRFFSQKI